MASAGQEIYEKVKAKMAAGMNTSQACAAVGEELGRSRQSVATTYYRWVKKDPTAPPVSQGRGRPRKAGGSTRAARRSFVAPGAAESPSLIVLAREVERLQAENARLEETLAKVRDLVK